MTDELDEFLEEVHEKPSRRNDPTFTKAMEEIVGERFGDFPDKTLDLLYQLWLKAKKVDTAQASQALTMAEMVDVRDTTLRYIDDYEGVIPPYPTDAEGYSLARDHPNTVVYNELLDEYCKRQQAEFDHLLINHDIPVIAPIHQSVFADALGLAEQRGAFPLLFIFPPRDFVDIRKLHVDHWGSGDVQLITDQEPLKGTLWGVPVVTTADLPSGTVYLAAARPERPPKSLNPLWDTKGTRQYMAAGRTLMWQRMDITR